MSLKNPEYQLQLSQKDLTSQEYSELLSKLEQSITRILVVNDNEKAA